MPSDQHSLVSVIIVNLNGARYLPDLLGSLERQTYPEFEVLVVDNGSTDGSVPLLRRSFPEVRVIQANRNLGFAGGNNLGIREARGSYVALINNDTVVDEEWLSHLVEEAVSDPKIGAVGSKILFARPFLPVTLEVPTFRPAGLGESADGRDLGVFLAESSRFEACDYRKPILREGFHGLEVLDGERGNWTQHKATVLLPVESLHEPGCLWLRVRSGTVEPRELRVSVGDTPVAMCELHEEWSEHRIMVPAEVSCGAGFDVLNNAGSFLLEDGTAGDRGIYESDRGQYETAEDVTSLCGCSMLLDRQVLEQVGGFEDRFFMYFEDTELCWRIRKAGYRLRYQPKSTVRHFHASTAVEWSPLFNFFVARNRILMLMRHAPLRLAGRAYLEELYRLLRLVMSRRSLRDSGVRTRLRIQVSLLIQLPQDLLRRIFAVSFAWRRISRVR